MAKRIVVTDTTTGDVEFCDEANGGYCIQISKTSDSGQLHIAGQLTNAKYGPKHWIKNEIYRPIVNELKNSFKETFSHVHSDRILFLEDMETVPSNKQKMEWVFRIRKASKDMTQLWGKWYVIESLNYWIERISDRNLVLQLYRCLRHIDGYGGIIDYEIKDWKETYGRFGSEANNDPHRQVEDILDHNFDWDVINTNRQMSLLDLEAEKKKRAYI